MILNKLTVFIIDDEPEVCHALQWLFESVNLQVETYHCAKNFLEKYTSNRAGCLIVDVRLPMMSGLELLEHLKGKNYNLPVIVITGYGDIPMAVRAMKAGAVDFILKPLNDQYLLEIIQKYLYQPSHSIQFNEVQERINTLTPREREILSLIVEGKLNKEISYELSIAKSTVEAHRAHIMQKMKVKTLAELIKIYLLTKYEVPIID